MITTINEWKKYESKEPINPFGDRFHKNIKYYLYNKGELYATLLFNGLETDSHERVFSFDVVNSGGSMITIKYDKEKQVWIGISGCSSVTSGKIYKEKL